MFRQLDHEAQQAGARLCNRDHLDLQRLQAAIMVGAAQRPGRGD